MAKSIHVKLNEALEALDKAGKRKQYNEKVQPQMNVESRLNLAEAILSGKSTPTKESASRFLEELVEAQREYGVLFGGQPAVSNEIVKPPIVKHNGVADNGGASVGMTENNTRKDIFAKGDKVMFDSMLRRGEITEAEHCKLTTGKPAEYKQLSEAQKKEFDIAQFVGINEADCLRLARMSGTNIREVSRR